MAFGIKSRKSGDDTRDTPRDKSTDTIGEELPPPLQARYNEALEASKGVARDHIAEVLPLEQYIIRKEQFRVRFTAIFSQDKVGHPDPEADATRLVETIEMEQRRRLDSDHSRSAKTF